MMTSPLDKEKVVAKIENSEVKIKGQKSKRDPPKTAKREAKTEEKPKTEKPEKKGKSTFTDEQFLNALKQLNKPATSREISDQLSIADPDVGRAYVRKTMERLIRAGKVVAVKPEGKTRVKLLYKLP